MSNSTGKPSGFTDTECYLAELCEKSFLTLWSYPNPFKNDGDQDRGGTGKELCDLLVIFGDHVIIFSDKNCAYPQSGKSELLDWQRWYRKAIQKSYFQVLSAEKWILRYPDRIFTDPKCQHRLPVALPPVDRMRIHRVVVTHKVADRCRQFHKGSGSLLIDTSITDEKHYEGDTARPFVVGQVDTKQGYVHVLDDTSLDAVLQNLDTLTDFVQYLERREALATKPDLRVVARSEEDLLAWYLSDIDEEERHDFIVPAETREVNLDDDFWLDLKSGEQYQRQQKADEISYAWDRLVEFISKHLLGGTLHFASHESFVANEANLRFLARETRLGRRILSRMLFELAHKSADPTKGDYALRAVLSDTAPDTCFVFLLARQPDGMSYPDYRQLRANMLGAVLRVAKLRFFGTVSYIVGIASEAGGIRSLHSYDMGHIDARGWDTDEHEQAVKIAETTGFLRNPQMYTGRTQEYPS